MEWESLHLYRVRCPRQHPCLIVSRLGVVSCAVELFQTRDAKYFCFAERRHVETFYVFLKHRSGDDLVDTSEGQSFCRSSDYSPIKTGWEPYFENEESVIICQ